MCISCVHYARFLTTWKTLFVHCSYVDAAVLPKPERTEVRHGIGAQAASEADKLFSRATAANASSTSRSCRRLSASSSENANRPPSRER